MLRPTHSLALTLVAACGSVSTKAPPMVSPDAPAGSSASPDAATDAAVDGAVAMLDAPAGPPCDRSKPFGAPVNVAGPNSSGSEMWGWLSPDGLTIYFDRMVGQGDYDIFQANRAHTTEAFGIPGDLSILNTADIDARPVTTADGLSMFLETTRSLAGDIYESSRSTTSDAWSDPVPVAYVDTSNTESSPWISPDGLVLYYASKLANGTADIVRTSRSSRGAYFSAPVALASLDTGANEYGPTLSDDGLEIYFASDRTGTTLIYRATRASASADFSAPTAVTELNDGAAQVPSWLSPDHCQLMFFSNRGGGAGDFDIWLATRPK